MRFLALAVLLPLIGLLSSFVIVVIAAAMMHRRPEASPCTWCGTVHAFSAPHVPCPTCRAWHSLKDGCLAGRTTRQVMDEGRRIQAAEESVQIHGRPHDAKQARDHQ